MAGHEMRAEANRNTQARIVAAAERLAQLAQLEVHFNDFP